MPPLALVISSVLSNAGSYAIDARANRHEIAIDMERIENRPHARSPASTTSERLYARLGRAAFTCRVIPVRDYFDNVLAELITPHNACGTGRYTSNAELRKALGELLTFHPEGTEVSVEARVKEMGLPSLLRDDPAYLPGTLTALSYDVGAHSVEIGRFAFPELDEGKEDALLFAGESELAFLHEGNPHAPLIREAHAAILGFHYRAAGMRGHTTLPPAGNTLAAKDDTTLADFTAQLARCRQRSDLGRSPRASGPYRHHDPLDLMQSGPCVIL
ncbi:hypothetical protein [Pandoraea fibrosis]|uniref:Uncharacterized protein n=1 Tax=Pandoraea fibrosis TaxID=1891094 RepID=A0A5E4Y7D6_9BURK|nr:hypothetical protein [Pandoraea fibrosis]VVE44641.1 hypothetical protein PFI31113_04310 [Pandoraea fibrosis]